MDQPGSHGSTRTSKISPSREEMDVHCHWSTELAVDVGEDQRIDERDAEVVD
jgi:hypothetical protein